MTKAVQDLMIEVERVRDAFQAAAFSRPDPDAAVALTTDDVALAVTPSGTGARGHDELHRFVTGVAAALPPDLTSRRVSRTVDRWRVAEEAVVGFTHDRELPWLLPGIAPTGRHVEVLTMSVVTVRRSLVTGHRTLWDHAGLLRALGLDPSPAVRPGGTVVG